MREKSGISRPYAGEWAKSTHTLLCRIAVIGLVFSLFFLGGCSLMGRKGSSTEPTQPKGVTVEKGAVGTKPYSIGGKTYYPLLSSHGFREEGIASWYGKDFHGKTTANGERYDMYGMTAAHKILPFNTQVKVTNLTNGRSIIVRINDRGPFVANRVIDLTHTGASKIGMIGPGTARVRVETVGAVPAIKNGDIMGNFYVQVGAFSRKDNAERLVAKFKSEGLNARMYYAETVYLWRVQVGPYPSVNRAETERGSLVVHYPGSFVVAE